MSTKRHKQWWNDSDGLIPTPPRPSRLLLKEMHPQGSSHWSGQQVNPALVGDASLPWDDFPDLGIHAQPTSSATGFYLPLCRSSWEPIPVCVKLQHHVKCFICFLKSQLCFFYTALNTSSSPQLHYFCISHPENIFWRFPLVLVFKHSEQLHSTALVRQR